MNKYTLHNLREFIVKIKQNIKSLKNLNLPVEHWNVLLIYTFLGKLDFNTRRAYEMERDLNALPTLNRFLSFLEKRCVRLENLSSSNETIQNNKIQKKSRHYSSSQNDTSTFQNNDLISIFCQEKGHKIYKCLKFRNGLFSDKSKFVKPKKLCSNCLGFHNVNHYFSQLRCIVCHKKHHTTLHNESNENDWQKNSPLNRKPTFQKPYQID